MVHPRADADAVTRDPQVICLGEALVDRIVAPLASAGAAAPWVDYPGGAPANVATALGKLGTVAGFLGCLGQDPPGDAVLAALVAAGVNCQWVQRCTAPTRVVLVQRNAQGDRQFVGFSQGHAADFADGALEARALPEPWFEQARYLVMGTLGLATPGLGQSMEQALVWARRYGVMTVVDLNWRSPFWPRPDQARDRILPFIHAVDILKLNQEEADWLFHTQAASQILPTLDRAQLVLVTGGAAGCWCHTHQRGPCALLCRALPRDDRCRRCLFGRTPPCPMPEPRANAARGREIGARHSVRQRHRSAHHHPGGSHGRPAPARGCRQSPPYRWLPRLACSNSTPIRDFTATGPTG